MPYCTGAKLNKLRENHFPPNGRSKVTSLFLSLQLVCCSFDLRRAAIYPILHSPSSPGPFLSQNHFLCLAARFLFLQPLPLLLSCSPPFLPTFSPYLAHHVVGFQRSMLLASPFHTRYLNRSTFYPLSTSTQRTIIPEWVPLS